MCYGQSKEKIRIYIEIEFYLINIISYQLGLRSVII
jgi:hypothetical protein